MFLRIVAFVLVFAAAGFSRGEEEAQPGRLSLPKDEDLVHEWKDARRLADQGALTLRSGVVRPAPGLDVKFANKAGGEQVAVVHFDAPVQKPLLDELQSSGLRVLYPLPPDAAVVKGTSKALATAAGRSRVLSVFSLRAEHKIEEALAARVAANAAEELDVTVYLHEPDGDGRVRARLEAAGLIVKHELPSIRALQGRVAANAVPQLAADPAVSFVEEQGVATAHLATSVGYSYAENIRADAAQYGKNIGVGIIDTGFLLSHAAFGAQSGYPTLNLLGWNLTGDNLGPYVDLSSIGHGTHVMGIMMSRWASQTPGLAGVAPWIGGVATQPVRVVRCGPTNTLSLVDTDSAINILTGDSGVQVINNSWGYSTNRSGANAPSLLVDSAVWNKGQLWIFSAGNDGNATPTIGSPAAAKNALAVGNVSNSYNATLAFSSSIGPTLDGRFKPEIYATGDQVLAPSSAGGTTGKLALTGTSMSAPHVAAVAATLLDHHPTLQRRPALAKALLVASAQRLSNLTVNASIGLKAGRVHSDRAHWASAGSTYYLCYADSGVTQSATQSWDIVVSPGYERMYVALMWIETNAPPLSLNRVINDIDLYVDQGANGSQDYFSTSGVDNYEFVTVANPVAGAWRFNAAGYSVSAPNKLGLCVFLEKDMEAPRANPPTWATPPYPSISGVNMILNPVLDLNAGVQYFFDEVTGIPGGTDSGWQTANYYEDTGLHDGFDYSYRAKSRDTSASFNETGYSTTAVAHTSARSLFDGTSWSDTRIPNRYTYGVFSQYWSVVAIAGATDHDLTLAADPAFGAILEESKLSGSTRDFIAVNGFLLNGPAYVEANFGAADSYRIEAEYFSETMNVGGAVSGTLNDNDVFDLFHLPLTNGQVVNLTLDQTFGNADLALFLLPPNSNKLSRIRTSRFANASGIGGDETYALTSTVNGVWGLLAMNENGGYAEYDLKALHPAGASISVTPSSRAFGSVIVGGYADDTFTVKNDGGGTLSGSASVSLPFSVVGGGSYNLGPNASQVVTIRFGPSSAVGSTQTVSFTGGGGVGRTVTGLGCVTSTPAISVSPPSANFGAVQVGASATQTFVVANVGAGNLSGSASVTSPFTLVSGGSYSLSGGATQAVVVRFTPASAVAYNGTIAFTGGGGATNTMSGSGYSNAPPAIAVTPASLDFGSVVVGGSSSRVFNVVNTGSGTLSGNVTGVSSPFGIVGGSPYVLGQGQGQDVVITYSPAAVGAHNQSLAFSGGGGASRTINGTAFTNLPPSMTITPSSHYFNMVQVGSYSDTTFVVQNLSGGPLIGAATAIAPVWVVSGGSYALSAGQSQTTTVRYIPTVAGGMGGYYLSFSGAGAPSSLLILGLSYDDVSDYDGDGMPDWAELRAGTGYSSPGSYLRMAGIAATGAAMRVSWDSVSGKYYRVVRNQDRPSGSPSILSNNIPAVSTNTIYLDADAMGPGPRFYHIELSY